MKRHKIIFTVSTVAAIILEILPFGAVCNFATPEKTIRQTYSYFSLTPYGYANFGPFITAVLSCVLLIFAIILFTSKGEKIIDAAKIISLISIITSLLPLLLGINNYSVTGFLISLLMILQFIVIIKIKKEVKKNEI